MPELNFKGKEFVYNYHLSVPYRPINPEAGKSVGDAILGGNLIIHGDNLAATKALLPMYGDAIDCVFIDPPYNTGSEAWSYNDNVNGPMFKEWLASNPVGIEDGLRHDKWCAMMYPRLRLLHELLSERGSLWITLDDNEVHRCRAMLDEIFGPDSAVAQVAWQKRTSRENRAAMSPSIDHVLCYSKALADTWRLYRNLLEPSEGGYSNPDNDPKGPWKSIPFSAQGFRKNQVYPITTPTGTVLEPPKGRCWGATEPEFERLKSEGRIYWPKEGEGRPRVKQYPVEASGLVPDTLWLAREVGDTEESKKELLAIFADRDALTFHAPKPVGLLRRILAIATQPNSVVLDSFAGTGTTAQAVLEQNKLDGGARRFILIEQESFADDLTAERVRRVIRGYAKRDVSSEELYTKKLTYPRFEHNEPILTEVADIESNETARFDRIIKRVDAGLIVVTGERDIDAEVAALPANFTYCTLGEPIELDALLTGKELPTAQALGAVLFHMATNRVFDAAAFVQREDGIALLGKAGETCVWLIYKPTLAFLQSAGAALTLSRAEALGKEFPAHRHVVFAAARFVSQKMLKNAGLDVEFAPLPWSLYRIERA